MVENTYIPRRTGTNGEYTFARLRAEGIELVQALSGKLWTDYNVHDPGVTILEALCYALTDLFYRTEFPTQDYLVNDDGVLEYEQLALYRPEAILPSEPVTVNDYRKLIFDAVPEIDNVWVQPARDAAVRGLYRIHAQLAQWVREAEIAEVSERVTRAIAEVFAAHRNLCEDLAEIRIVPHQHYSLRAVVEVGDEADAGQVLGEIYFRAAQLIGRGLPFRSYAEVVDGGRGPEDVFDGPLTHNVVLTDEDLALARPSLSVAEIASVIGTIQGVRRVERIELEDESGTAVRSLHYDDQLQVSPHLRLPASAADVTVTLRQGGRELTVPFRQLEYSIEQHFSGYRSRRMTRQEFADIFPPPQGEYREFRTYYSIQNELPNTYGINRFGLPESSNALRKSQAANLKVYLLMFEQVMADFLEDLQQRSRLFSADRGLSETSFFQILSNARVPNVEDLYSSDVETLPERLRQIIHDHDDFLGRRNRVLDYLLAIYGESFKVETLHGLDMYGEMGVDRSMINAKVELLKSIGNAD